MTLSKTHLPGHALLLTSLFRGFHLDAYVTLGTALTKTKPSTTSSSTFTETATAWVTTVTSAPGGSTTAVFWDPVTGTRCSSTDAWDRGYRSVGCMSHESGIWANVGATEGVLRHGGVTSFDVEDGAVWKGMAREVVDSMRR